MRSKQKLSVLDGRKGRLADDLSHIQWSMVTLNFDF